MLNLSKKKYMGVNKVDQDYDSCCTKNLIKQLGSINKDTDGNTKDRWTTYLAYLLKLKQGDIKDSKDIICKYEAILTQCSYLSRMAYTPAEIFCRMTKFLDLTPNAFNDYIRVIEKIMNNKLEGSNNRINYEYSYNSLWLIQQPLYQKLFSKKEIKNVKSGAVDDNIRGYFIRNNKNLNVYIYYHKNTGSKFNDKPTIYVAFKGASSFYEFFKGLGSQLKGDLPISNLGITGIDEKLKAGKSYIDVLLENTTGNISTIQDVFNKVNILIDKYSGKTNEVKTNEAKANEGKPNEGKTNEGKTNEIEIVITGHSLGGAFAVLFAFYYMKHQQKKTNPVHLVTLGETTVMNEIARNEFNKMLNSLDKGSIFTYDRIESTTKKGGIGIWRNMFTKLPIDLNHPGYSILQTEFSPFKKTGRTNEIRELRALCGFINPINGDPSTKNTENDLFEFVKLFKNSGDFMTIPNNNGNYKMNNNKNYVPDNYKSKLRVLFGTNKSSQILIIKKAIQDAKPEAIQLFNKIEDMQANTKIVNKQPVEQLNQVAGGLIFKSNSQKIYENLNEQMMPNGIIYDCNTKISLFSCVGSYMGVSYMPVLRLPSVKIKNPSIMYRKEPKTNYTLYEIGDRLYSINSEKSNTFNKNVSSSNASSSTSSNASSSTPSTASSCSIL